MRSKLQGAVITHAEEILTIDFKDFFRFVDGKPGAAGSHCQVFVADLFRLHIQHKKSIDLRLSLGFPLVLFQA